jgi:hypothetical protein
VSFWRGLTVTSQRTQQKGYSHMTIPYSLDNNNLNDKGGFFARTRSHGTADLDTIAERIVARGSTVGKADVLAVLHLLLEVILDLVLDGWRVNLGGLVHLYCSIEGLFNSHDEHFTPGRHKLKGIAKTGARYERALKTRGKVARQVGRRFDPLPRMFTDLLTEAHDRFTPGGKGQLYGRRLKLDLAAPDEGVFLIDQAGQTLKLSIIYNTTSLLIFDLPDSPLGSYRLEVRARPHTSTTLRAARLDKPLLVGESPG